MYLIFTFYLDTDLNPKNIPNFQYNPIFHNNPRKLLTLFRITKETKRKKDCQIQNLSDFHVNFGPIFSLIGPCQQNYKRQSFNQVVSYYKGLKFHGGRTDQLILFGKVNLFSRLINLLSNLFCKVSFHSNDLVLSF